MEQSQSPSPLVEPVPAPASRLPGTGTTIFTVMSELAREHGAINLSQGFPDFDGPPALLDAVTGALHSGLNQYAPMPGLPALREAVAEKVRDLYGAAVDPDGEVTITPGATVALYCALMAVARPGDEVVLLDPAYDAYAAAVRLAGAVPVRLPLRAPAFRVDWDAVRDAIGPRTCAIVLNTPHNPTGTVLDAADAEALQDILTGARHRPVYLIADEVYEHILFDGARHESALRHPHLRARAFVVSSFGKTFHVTGWKLGYCVAPAQLTAEFRRIYQFVNFTAITPVQHGLAAFMRSRPDWYEELAGFYQGKRDRFCELLAPSRFRLRPSAGTYFQLAEYDGISDEDDVTLARRLTREAGVAAIPVSVFYEAPPAQRVLRFCFAKDDVTLGRAAEILCRL